MGLVKTLFTNPLPPALKDYYDSLLSGLIPIIFDASNADSGTTSVTINEMNGVATFTGSASANDITNFVINNSLITAASLLDINIKYPSTAGGGIITNAGYTCTSGVFEVSVYNVDGSASASDIIITFQILSI